jgi:Tfp pilus assembly protein PilX
MKHRSVPAANDVRYSAHRPSLGGRRGSVYVLAIVTLLVAVTLGMAMLKFVDTDFRAQTGETRRVAASNLAEAGVDHATWQIVYKGKNVPFSTDLTLNTGTVHVDVADDSARATSAVLITSTGRSGSYRSIAKRSIPVLPYLYAWCENSNLSTDKTVYSTGMPGGIRVNGSVNLNRIYTNVTTGVWATSTISTTGTATPRYPSSPVVAFPDIDYNYLRSKARAIYYGDKYFYNLWRNQSGVYYVSGRAIIGPGVYDGYFTIVSTGDVIITNDYTKYSSDSYLAVITTGQISIQGSADNVDAILYAHKSDGSGDIHCLASLFTRYICGAVVADKVDNDSTISVERDPGLTPAVMRQLHLPGVQE